MLNMQGHARSEASLSTAFPGEVWTAGVALERNLVTVSMDKIKQCLSSVDQYCLV